MRPEPLKSKGMFLLPALLALFLIFILTVSLTKTTQGFTTISRSQPVTTATVLARARQWVQANVRYSQVNYYPDAQTGYRQDCSGFVSMAYQLPHAEGNPNLGGPNTTQLSAFFHKITRQELQPGDLLLKQSSDGHVIIFVKWNPTNPNRYDGLEETGWSKYHKAIERDLAFPYDNHKSDYVPMRYNGFADFKVGIWSGNGYYGQGGSFDMTFDAQTSAGNQIGGEITEKIYNGSIVMAGQYGSEESLVAPPDMGVIQILKAKYGPSQSYIAMYSTSKTGGPENTITLGCYYFGAVFDDGKSLIIQGIWYYPQDVLSPIYDGTFTLSTTR